MRKKNLGLSLLNVLVEKLLLCVKSRCISILFQCSYSFDSFISLVKLGLTYNLNIDYAYAEIVRHDGLGNGLCIRFNDLTHFWFC